MADHIKVVVYVRAPDARRLKAQGVKDIPAWVRGIVRKSIDMYQRSERP